MAYFTGPNGSVKRVSRSSSSDSSPSPSNSPNSSTSMSTGMKIFWVFFGLAIAVFFGCLLYKFYQNKRKNDLSESNSYVKPNVSLLDNLRGSYDDFGRNHK